MRSSLLSALLAAVAVAPGPVPGPSAFRPADPAHDWAFPRDHFARPGYRNEWWYFTGIVETSEGRRLGFQLTFFRVGLLAQRPSFDSAWAASDAVMAHLALTDPAAGRHVFSEVLTRAMPLLGGFGAAPGPVVAFVAAPPGTAGRWSLELDGAIWRLSARDDTQGVALDLAAAPKGPLVLEGPNGYSRKAAAGDFASEYYSLPRLEVAGTLTLEKAPASVRGQAWMDREVGSAQLAPGQVGWDWMGLRLADGRDLMLYVMRRADGAADFESATLVDADGRATLLDQGAWSLRPTGGWHSPVSGADYPSGWRVEVPQAGLSLEVRPEFAGAENRSRLLDGLFYWEGPVRVLEGGRSVGEGYAELTGRGKGSRPPL
jgi:predicted secreted hydrolase